MSDELTLPEVHGEGRTILVVDDEDLVRELLSRWLAKEGWNCAQAPSAADALAYLESYPVQIVVSDIKMPGQSGLWLLEQVIARFPDTSVLMLTGSSETSTAIEALMLGAAAYLLKPIQRDEFLIQVRQAHHRRQLIVERRHYLQTLEKRVTEQTLEIRQAHEETIHRLVTAAGYRDEETGAHIRRTGLFSEVLALAAGWSTKEAELLRMAAPMHDVGKIGIPDSILQKPGKLTPEEFERMKQHTTIGARMLAGSASPILQLAEKIALSHHERWDGAGYPHALCGEAIPEAARIVSVVDVYDALSHDRVYRPAWTEDAVLSTLAAGQGSQFDPTLLALFLSSFEQIRAIAEAHPDECDHSYAEPRLSVFPAISSLLPAPSSQVAHEFFHAIPGLGRGR